MIVLKFIQSTPACIFITILITNMQAVVQHCGIFERSDWVRIYSSVWLNCLNVKRALTNYYRQPKIIGRRFKANQFTHSRIYCDKLPTVSTQNRNSDIDKGLNTNILLFAAFGWLVKFKHVRVFLCAGSGFWWTSGWSQGTVKPDLEYLVESTSRTGSSPKESIRSTSTHLQK